MRYFWVRLLQPLSTLHKNTTKSRLIATKASLSFAILKKNFDCAWLRLHILPSLHLRSTCERRLRLHLHRMSEPGFKVGLKEMCYTSPLFPRLTIHLLSPSDITGWILTRSSVTCVDDTNVQALDCLATAYQRSYNLGYHSKEYCRLVTAHTSAQRKRYKDTIKKALKACSIVLKHRTATAEMPDGALPSTKKLNLEPIWNLESTNENSESSTWNLEPTSWNPKSNTVLEHLVWGKLHVNNTGATP